MKKYSILIVDDKNNVVTLLEKSLIKQSYIIYKSNCEETSLKVILIAQFINIKIAIEAFRMCVFDYINKTFKFRTCFSFCRKIYK